MTVGNPLDNMALDYTSHHFFFREINQRKASSSVLPQRYISLGDVALFSNEQANRFSL
jgi:lipase chaperone LimK